MITLDSIQQVLSNEYQTFFNAEDVVFVARQLGVLPDDGTALQVLSENMSDEWLRPITDKINILSEDSFYRNYLCRLLGVDNDHLDLTCIKICTAQGWATPEGKPIIPKMCISSLMVYYVQRYGDMSSHKDIKDQVLADPEALELVKMGRDRAMSQQLILPSVATHVTLIKLAKSRYQMDGPVKYFPLDEPTVTSPVKFVEPDPSPEPEVTDESTYAEGPKSTSAQGKVKNTRRFADSASDAWRSAKTAAGYAKKAGGTVAGVAKKAGHTAVEGAGNIIEFTGRTTRAAKRVPGAVSDRFHAGETEEEHAKRMEKAAEKERLKTLAKEEQIKANAEIQKEEARQETLRLQNKYANKQPGGFGSALKTGLGLGIGSRLSVGRSNQGYSSGYDYSSGYGYGQPQRGGFFRGRQQTRAPRERKQHSAFSWIVIITVAVLIISFLITYIRF